MPASSSARWRAGRRLPIPPLPARPPSPARRPSGGGAPRRPEAASWAGLFAPAGTPPDLIARLNGAVTAIIGAPAFRDRYMVALGLEPGAIELAAIKTFLAKDRAAW